MSNISNLWWNLREDAAGGLTDYEWERRRLEVEHAIREHERTTSVSPPVAPSEAEPDEREWVRALRERLAFQDSVGETFVLLKTSELRALLPGDSGGPRRCAGGVNPRGAE